MKSLFLVLILLFSTVSHAVNVIYGDQEREKILSDDVIFIHASDLYKSNNLDPEFHYSKTQSIPFQCTGQSFSKDEDGLIVVINNKNNCFNNVSPKEFCERRDFFWTTEDLTVVEKISAPTLYRCDSVLLSYGQLLVLKLKH